MKYVLSILVLVQTTLHAKTSKLTFNKMLYDSVAVYRLKGNISKVGDVDYFWKKRDSSLQFICSIPADKMTTLFQIIEDRAYYYSEPKFTPGFNVSVVFFLHRKKTGYMSFDFRG
ncbi:MAG: hypothetical protein H7257_08415, partial [Taibaiella sp.]|nr:hypothetical protein [Taibaiella sp.]